MHVWYICAGGLAVNTLKLTSGVFILLLRIEYGDGCKHDYHSVAFDAGFTWGEHGLEHGMIVDNVRSDKRVVARPIGLVQKTDRDGKMAASRLFNSYFQSPSGDRNQRVMVHAVYKCEQT